MPSLRVAANALSQGLGQSNLAAEQLRNLKYKIYSDDQKQQQNIAEMLMQQNQFGQRMNQAGQRNLLSSQMNDIRERNYEAQRRNDESLTGIKKQLADLAVNKEYGTPMNSPNYSAPIGDLPNMGYAEGNIPAPITRRPTQAVAPVPISYRAKEASMGKSLQDTEKSKAQEKLYGAQFDTATTKQGFIAPQAEATIDATKARAEASRASAEASRASAAFRVQQTKNSKTKADLLNKSKNDPKLMDAYRLADKNIKAHTELWEMENLEPDPSGSGKMVPKEDADYSSYPDPNQYYADALRAIGYQGKTNFGTGTPKGKNVISYSDWYSKQTTKKR